MREQTVSVAPPFILLPGKSLRGIVQAAVVSSFQRHRGNRGRMLRELGISKSALLRHLLRLGLRETPLGTTRHLREIDIALAFQRHRGAITAELRISDSALMRWIEKRLPDLLGATR